MKTKLAAQLYTVRKFTTTDDEVKRALSRIREIGYTAVQISGIGAYNPQNIAAALKENGLTVCATHTPLDRIKNDTERVIEEHLLFGAPYVGLGGFWGDTLEEYKAFAESLMPAVEKFNAAGLRFLYHNHATDLKKYNGVYPLAYFAQTYKSGVFDFLPDLYWLQKAGWDSEKFLRDYKGRTPVVHFKDMRVPPKEGMTDMAEIFEGNMNYESIYKTCEETGVEWVAVEQDDCDGDPFESLKISYENMKNRGMFL